MNNPELKQTMLSDELDPKRNSLSFVRFFLASLVLFSHSHPLSGIGTEHLYGSKIETWGLLGVYGFFALSGFLITQSFDRTSSVLTFFWHRFLRIYPGFIVCILVTAFGFGPLFQYLEKGTLEGFLAPHPYSAWHFVLNNMHISISQWSITDLLKTVPHPEAVNGSLWTLIYEVYCYLLVALVGTTGLLGRVRWFTAALFLVVFLLMILSLGSRSSAASLMPPFLDKWMLRFSLFFIAGMVFAKFDKQIPINWKLFVLCFVILKYTLSTKGFFLFAPFCIPYLIFYAGCRLPFSNFDKYGDWSYGMYIYAFPVQQTLALLRVYEYGFYPYFIACMLVTIVFAALSYYLIEAPALRLKNVRLFSKA